MDENKFVKAVEPLVDEVKRIRDKVDAFEVKEGPAGEPGKDADPAQVAEIVVQKYADQLRGVDGANGQDADPEQVAEIIAEKHADVFRGAQGDQGPAGSSGQDGLGFNVKSWGAGIYREGSIVQHNIGQVFFAKRDTNNEPGTGDDWERMGLAGFRWTGVKNADFAYQDGDMYIDGGTTFLFWEGKGRMLAQRGKNGQDGADGKDGLNGKDAANIVHAKMDHEGFVLAFDDGDVLTVEVEGQADIIKRLTFLEDQLVNQVEDIDAPIKRFAGTWKVGESYATGDVVKFSKGLYLCIKADKNSDALDPDYWVKLAGSTGGSAAGGGGMISPPDMTRSWSYRFVPNTLSINGQWSPDYDSVTAVKDLSALFAIKGPDLVNGRAVFVRDSGQLYYFVGTPATPTGTLGDWKPVGSGSSVVNKVANLPQPSATVNVSAGDVGVVKFRNDGVTPEWQIYIADIVGGTAVWHPANQAILSKGLLTDPDTPDAGNNDFQVTMENGHQEIKIYDKAVGAWVTIYSEDQIKGWIAAGNLFTGTLEEKGYGIAGAIELDKMPTEASLGPTDKGHYWTWVGTSGHVLAGSELGGAISAIDGQKLNVGDWIQVAEPAPGTFQYTVIPGDLLTKSRGTALFGMATWVAGAYEQGSIVVTNGKLYKATVPILTSDAAPDFPGQTKWAQVQLSASAINVNTDGDLPATAKSGDIYLVKDSTKAGGGPALYTYDTNKNKWVQVGGQDAGGETIFFGRGQFDPSDTTAANNYGMPAGYKPAGVPKTGDIYFDLEGGSETAFTVTSNPPNMTISGTFDPNSIHMVYGSGSTEINGLTAGANSGPAAGFKLNEGSVLNGSFTATAGPLNGVAFNMGDYIIWSGDTGTQYGGWVVVRGPKNATFTWTANTTTATPVPDTFAGVTTWGEKRQFTVTMPGTVRDGDFYQVLTNFESKTDLYRIAVVEQAQAGSIFEFFLADEGNTGSKSFLGAEIIRNGSTAKPILNFHTNHNGSSGLCLYFELESAAAGQTFTITVEGANFQGLGGIKLDFKAAAKAGIESTLDGQTDYPTPDLVRRLQIMSGSGTAGLPPNLKPSDNADGYVHRVGSSGLARLSGYWQFQNNVTHDKSRCLITFQRGNGSLIPSLASIWQNGHGLESAGSGTGLNVSLMRQASLSDHSLPTSYNSAFYGRDYRFSLEIDNRRPGQTKVFYESWYTQYNDVPSYMWFEFFTAGADMIKSVQFSGHGGTGVLWNVYID